MRTAFGYFLRCALFFLTALSLAAFAHAEPSPTVIVVDSSNSMSAPLDGEVRLDTARKVLGELLDRWPSDAPLGLIAYGHRRAGDCKDIELLAPIGPVDAPALTKKLTALRARGKTPLASSIEQAAALLAEKGQGGTIILVTDGVETCRADPCAVAAALKKANAGLTIHVVGFAVDRKDEEQLSCIAEAGGGAYRTATDAAALSSSVREAASEAVAAPAPQPPSPKEAPPAPPPPPAPPKAVQVAFKALIEGEGPLVDHPAAWRITGTAGTTFSYEGESRGLSLELMPGRYTAEARASNAAAGTSFQVASGSSDQTVDIVLPAGRLAAHAVPHKGADRLIDGQGLVWTLAPLDGQPAADVPAIAQPSWLLAAGRYRLTAARGADTGSAEVTIAPGKPQDIEISFRLGQLKLSAAAAENAPPLTDWKGLVWRAINADGATAAEIDNEAQPTLLLPAGPYSIELAIAGTTLKHSVQIAEATTKDDRFIVPAGNITLTAALGPDAEPFTDWRDTSWTVTPIQAVGLSPGVPLAENQLVSNPIFPLMPGRWTVTVKSGLATASREIEVAPDSAAMVRLDLGAARLTIAAEPSPTAPPSVNVVFVVTPLQSDGMPGEALSLGGSSREMATILPAGRYRVTVSDEQDRTAEQEIDLAAGQETAIVLSLK